MIFYGIYNGILELDFATVCLDNNSFLSAGLYVYSEILHSSLY